MQFNIGAQALTSLQASVCEQNVDIVGCQMGVIFTGLELGGQYRVAEHTALGLIGAIGWEPGYDQRNIMLWRMAADGRVYPFVGRMADFWISIEAGIAGVHGWLTEVDPGESEKKIQDRQVGPEIGANSGLDIEISERLAMSFTARALWLILSNSRRESVSSHLDLDKAFWLQVGVGLRWQVPV